jgi:pilus assembly protein CpaB
MRRRILAAVAAVVLLVAGAGVLVAYVNGADARALAGVRTVDVLVADAVIPEGTPAADLPALVRTVQVPARSAVGGRVDDLASLTGRVADVDLQPGEQLLAARFVRPDERQAPGTVAVPAGLQEVSIVLDPQRAVGGRLAAGDEVGVILSVKDALETHAVLHSVLVTQIQGAPATATAEETTQTASAGSTPAPTGSLMVTLAVTAPQAEAVVWGVEHGTVWLTLEPEDADTGGTQVLTPGNIYGKAFA